MTRPAARGVRIVSWNVRSLRDDSAGVAAVLRGLRPDVVLVQEAPRLLLWRLACRRLARSAGLVRVVGGAPGAGNLLLVHPGVGVVSARALRLPRRPRLHRRGAVTAVLEAGGLRFAVLGTHLDLDADARLDSARRLRQAAPPDVPLVVGADLNEEPGGRAWAVLSSGLADVAADCGPTFPLRAPRRRIDAVFVDPRLRVERVDVPQPGPVTDHLPIVVDLAAPPP